MRPDSMHRPRIILPTIVFAQFAGTSLWFAGNAVLGELQAAIGETDLLGLVTGAVQAGFIVGTLVSAFTGFADRVSPRRLFLMSAILGAVANLSLLWADSASTVGLARFFTGICLAGIYPIGMKIAAGWFRDGLGWALGLLVGALVAGTAFPHLLRELGATLPWRSVILGTSILATLGGLCLYLWVPDGHHLSRAPTVSSADLRRVFAVPEFRRAAFGYWGHMWELYTVWALVPTMLADNSGTIPISGVSAAVIGIGALGCVAGGGFAQRIGSRAVTATLLGISGVCCVLYPWMRSAPTGLFVAYLLVWGMAVVGDSPQFSPLNARSAPRELLGTGLTVVTSVGFALTIGSIELAHTIGDVSLSVPLLAIGPLIGLVSLRGGSAT